MLQSILTKIQMFISTSQGMETPNQYKVKEDIIAKRKSQNQAKPTEKKKAMRLMKIARVRLPGGLRLP